MAFERGRDMFYIHTIVIRGSSSPAAFPLDRPLFRSQFARVTDRTLGPIDHQPYHRARSRDRVDQFHHRGSVHARCRRGLCHARCGANRDRAVFCQFGEGATSEGEWHEAMNFSALKRLPIVFVCENNRWAISTPQNKQMAVEDVASRAAGYGMPGVIVDGFDPIAVYQAVRAARERALNGGGPTLVEAKCYRFLSHTTDDDDRTYRTREEVESQRKLDPVPRFERRLLDALVLTEPELEALRAEVTATVNATTDIVESEPLPESADLYGNVYANSDDAWC